MPRNEGKIQARGLKKAYLPGASGLKLLSSALRRQAPADALWALNGVDLDVGPGEALALIGRNGSGKSSLLRLLAGASDPDAGSLQVQGRVGSLLDLGAGLHPEFKGSANARLQGRLYGLSRAELPDYLQRVREFSGLGPAWEQPCKGYSSGMSARLGFACAVCVDPAVLLVDEVLAVGDEAFQERCLERIRGLMANGCAAVIASHQAATLRAFCTQAIVLEAGTCVFHGPLDEAIALHHSRMAEAQPSEDPSRPAPLAG